MIVHYQQHSTATTSTVLFPLPSRLELISKKRPDQNRRQIFLCIGEACRRISSAGLSVIFSRIVDQHPKTGNRIVGNFDPVIISEDIHGRASIKKAHVL
jgi:hypothetical protein